MKLNKWVEAKIKELEAHDVKVILDSRSRVYEAPDDPDPCEGYFSDGPDKLELAIATANPEWRKIFIHEYCHFKQHKLNTKEWKDLDEGDLRLTEWLKGKDFPAERIKHWIDRVRAMEKQCEMFAVEYIRRNKFFSVKDYIMGANAYLFFYTVLLDTRKWYQNPPDASTKLKLLMPNKFLRDYSVMPNDLKKVFIKECYNK